MSLHTIKPEIPLTQYFWVHDEIPCGICNISEFSGGHHRCGRAYLKNEYVAYCECRVCFEGNSRRIRHYFASMDSVICSNCTKGSHPNIPLEFRNG